MRKSEQYSSKLGKVLVLVLLCISPIFIWGQQLISPYFTPSIEAMNAPIELIGDENLCLVVGGVLGTYHAGGEDGDVYYWTLTDSQGNVIDAKSSGQLETYKYVFSVADTYKISLRVQRGADPNIYSSDLPVLVQEGPVLTLPPDHLLCGTTPVTLTAIDPDTPNISSYTFKWTNSNDSINVLSTANTLEVTYPGFYNVTVSSATCNINGTSYVGPPIDFQITKSTETLCEGGSVNFGIDTPLIGEWFIQKENDAEKKSLGSNYNININSSELSGPGIYQVSFRAENPDMPDCSSERHVNIELLAAPDIKISTIKPDDCALENGSIEITTTTDLTSLTVLETGYSIANLVSGQIVPIPNLQAGIYTIEIERNGCTRSSLVRLEAEDPPTSSNPPNQTTVETVTTPESCSPEGVEKGNVHIQFGKTITTGTYRVLSSSSGLIAEESISNQDEININLAAGNYLVELKLDGCTYPFEEFTIERQPAVNFTIPSNLNICEFYDLFPQSDEKLIYTLTYPGGNTETITNGESFLLTEEGEFSIYAQPADPNATTCGKTIIFTTTFSQNINFSPELIIADCYDPISYRPNIEGLTPDEVSIRWLNDEDEIVGRGAVFYPAQAGEFFLLVQPLKSGFCPAAPVAFLVEPPITSIDLQLEANKICPSPGTSTITLTTQEKEEIRTTEWIFYDPAGNREELVSFNDLFEITVDKVGSYEVITYNDRYCEIGREIITVEESSLTTLPDLEDSYAICSKKNTLSPLDPGEFKSYQWFFEGQLLSEERLFYPEQVGNYELQVTTEDACVFTHSFTTFDACDFQIAYPNAMVIGDNSRDFSITVSKEVEEVELFILNRQGALIHHAHEVDVPEATAILHWDGKVNGKSIPIGTYAVVIILRNQIFGFEEKLTSALLVIE